MKEKIKIFGYLRETIEQAQKAGIDKVTGLCRTGLDEYLEVIFPDINDWIHDKPIGELNGIKCRYRPDYYSPSLKLIVEFDGLNHYQSPSVIMKDKQHTEFYEAAGLKVVRIPYFIQLSRNAVNKMFGINLDFELFDENIPSLFPEDDCTPAYLCPLGIARMAEEFKKYPKQYTVNIKSMKKNDNMLLTGVNLLEKFYNSNINTDNFLSII